MAPDTVKSVPLMVAELMVNGVVPVEVNVTGSVTEEPSLTVPKLRLVEVTANCGLGGGATPVLVRLIEAPLRLAALLLMVSVPSARLTALGANVTRSVTVC